jgi:hypothetical protein
LLMPVRLVDGLPTERNAPGDAFLATLDGDLALDGLVIAERGARVEGKARWDRRSVFAACQAPALPTVSKKWGSQSWLPPAFSRRPGAFSWNSAGRRPTASRPRKAMACLTSQA